MFSKPNREVMTREKLLQRFHTESFAVGRFRLKL